LRTRWIGVVAAAAMVVLGFVAWKTTVRTPIADRGGVLRLADQGEIALLSAPDTAARSFELSDGSRIELDARTRIEALENGPAAFSVLFSQGRATFDVRPGGPRRWSIECGLVTVEVVGTRFVVERSAAAVRVSVERGIVLVRGERLRDRVRKLTAGESVEVTDAASDGGRPQMPEAQPEVLVPTGVHQPAAPPVVASAAPSAQAARAPPAWRSFAQRGDNAEAYATLGPAGIASATQVASVDDLLALADVARLSGHPAEAVAPLTRVVSEHANDPRTPLAAFTLGRVQLDVVGHPAEAASAFAQAIALGLPQSLEEDAYARLVQARARAGDAAGARAAAHEYEQRFPSGKRLNEVREWTRSE
jgi:transmembrane sensor